MSQSDGPQQGADDEVNRSQETDGGDHEPLAVLQAFPWRRCALSLAFMVLILLGSLAGGIYWRLGKGPLGLPFLSEHALQAIGERLPPGYGVDLSDVALVREDGALTIVLADLTLRDAAGIVLASAPSVDVELDGMSLLTGRIEPRAIVLNGASAAASIDKAGRVGLRAGATAPAMAPAADLSVLAMMNALDAIMAAAGTIDTVELRSASLTVHDKAFNRESTYPDITVAVRRTSADGGLAFSLAAGGGTIDATIEGRGEGARLVDVKATAISLSQIASRLAPGARPPRIAASLDAVGRARLAEDGTVQQASIAVSSLGGSWQVEPDLPPFRFDRLGIALRWEGTEKVLYIDKAEMAAGEGQGQFSGRMVPPADGATDWLIELDAPLLTIDGAAGGELPLKLDTASIRGRYNTATRILGIDHAQFSGPTAKVAMAGSVSLNGQTPGIGLGIAGDRMPVAAVKRLWPFFAAAPARKWFLEHAKGGMLERGTISLAIPPDALIAVDGVIPPLPDSAIKGEMVFSQSSMSVVDTLPPVTDLDAVVTFSARRVSVAAGPGKVDVGGAGQLTLSKGLYEIADLVPKPAMQRVMFDMSGPAQAVAELMTRDPLDSASNGVDLEPAQVSGRAELHVELAFPTLDKPTPDDFTYAIRGDLTDLGIAQFEGQKLENGSLKLAVERDVVLLTGKATLAGVPARIDYRKAKASAPQVTVTATLDDAARKSRGLDFGDALNGPVTAEIRIAHTDNGPRYGMDIDLAAARVKDLLPGWQKAPGKPGKASLVWIPDGDGGTVDSFSLDSGPVSLRGNAILAQGKLRKAKLDVIRFAPGDDASGTVESFGSGWKLALRGKSLDLRPILSMLQRKGPSSGKASDLAVDLELDRAGGFGDEVMTGLDLAVETKAQLIRRFSLKGNFGTRGIAGAMRDSGNGSSEIYVETVDAGSLMRFLDYYTHVQGGVLQAALTPTLDRTAGQIFMRDFKVTNETALGQYRNSLQRSGRSEADAIVRSEDSDSARFNKLRLTFDRTPDSLTIAEGVVWGPEIGANLSGTIDYRADRVNLTGTFVPAYALNNLFSQIPVLGAILGGGRNEGLFAINFKVTGSVSAPTLTVNPLSAIAPGFLRKLFEFQKQ